MLLLTNNTHTSLYPILVIENICHAARNSDNEIIFPYKI